MILTGVGLEAAHSTIVTELMTIKPVPWSSSPNVALSTVRALDDRRVASCARFNERLTFLRNRSVWTYLSLARSSGNPFGR